MTPEAEPGHDLWFEAMTAEEAGQREDALDLLRQAASMGNAGAMSMLGTMLTDMGAGHRPEGRDWLARASEAGYDAGAWNLAMDHRLCDEPNEYLIWMRRAADLGHDDAPAIVATIDRMQAEGRPWPMYIYAAVDRDTVWGMIQGFRDGDFDAETMRRSMLAIHLRQSAVAIVGPTAPALARVIAELAGIAGSPLTQTRATELIFKLQSQIPDADPA